MLQGLGRDLRIAARRLIATPLFTTFAVLSLAVGIGVTTVAYSFVESVFFKPLPIQQPERAVFVMTSDNGRLRFQSVISRPDFDDLRASQQSFSSLAASWAFNPSLAGPATTELVRAEAITGDYFRTLGVTAALGRTILPADDESAAAVAVLGHDLWRARFASDPQVVGQTVRIGGLPFEIVGVASRSFVGAVSDFGFYGTRVWVPLGTAPRFASAVRWFAAPARPGAVPRPNRERRDLTVVGRLRADVGVDSAVAELSRLSTPRIPIPFPLRGRR